MGLSLNIDMSARAFYEPRFVTDFIGQFLSNDISRRLSDQERVKANCSYMALNVFHEMKSQKCKPNICTYTALINAFAREGLCEKAEEIFKQLQEAGIEPDVYSYNALMEAYSRAGFPYGASEIFLLMQHMGCEPDRSSFNIMVDAYGRSGLHEVVPSPGMTYRLTKSMSYSLHCSVTARCIEA